MIELRDFVSEAICQIVEGVADAQRRLHPVGGYVNPPDAKARIASGEAHKGVRYSEIPGAGPYQHEVTTIEFDMAVTATESSQRKGGIGVLASVVNLAGSKGSAASMESATRVRFSVPVVFPHFPAYEPKAKQVTAPVLPPPASTPRPSPGPPP